ncbi:DNA-binding protein [Streptococcus sp. 121]|uniref:DNA-binding protein n=1 Tax=Streptococcus sp. 121 TaxID=2797637 RepID=UPI0018F0A3AB|nr:DNA-binding protein [Streptococcus sp. 121]MBJ6746430.1 DNA-binding protein [Streptococcus sp. 121]
MSDLTTSQLERQNILNNTIAIKQAEEEFNIKGVPFEGKYYYTNQQLADFFSVTTRTIERIIEGHSDELRLNGFEVITGKRLADFKSKAQLTDINVGQNTRNLGISTFRVLLNFAMLLSTSDKAKQIRARIIDIVINVLTEKTGGYVNYINQRDSNYLTSALKENTARNKFTTAVGKFVEGNQYKYAHLTNAIYKAIFRENASEYRKILKLKQKDNVRRTLYSEVLLLIASFENGIAQELEDYFNKKGTQLTFDEAKSIIQDLASHALFEPLLHDARTKMASRDLSFRDALHTQLAEYITPVTEEDFEKFLGEQSRSLEDQIEEHREIFQRLKDK